MSLSEGPRQCMLVSQKDPRSSPWNWLALGPCLSAVTHPGTSSGDTGLVQGLEAVPGPAKDVAKAVV